MSRAIIEGIQMNIAMLTTWNSRCGIAEYSQNLAREFSDLGHRVLILANYGEDNLQVNISNVTVARGLWGVHWWGEDPTIKVDLATEAMRIFEQEHGPIDVFHVQYQGSLYEPDGFNQLIQKVKQRKVITLHDSSVNPKHDFNSFDVTVTHRPMKFTYGKYFQLPMPTIRRPIKVFSFGMGGRNDYKLLKQLCDSKGYEFDYHDAREHGWLMEETLFERMQKADVIVLWYNEVPIKGQSSALRTAISSHRPVVVNSVGWFEDAPDFVYRAGCIEDCGSLISKAVHEDYIYNNSYEHAALTHTNGGIYR